MNGVMRSSEPFDLDALRHEVAQARSIQDFEKGAYGHCISLPCAEDMPEAYRTHHNNVPFSGALRRCPLARRIFDQFRTEKASFRLLRRGRESAYSLHDDRDKGNNIVRLQIPIVTNEQAFIVLLEDGVSVSDLAAVVARIREDAGDEIWFDFEKFEKIFGGYFALYALAPGFLYYFDTDRIHTAINAGREERIVLSIDLVMNDWLKRWMADNLIARVTPTPKGRAIGGKWNWTALKHGLITHRGP